VNKRTHFLAMVAFVFSLALSSSSFAQKISRISFAKGAISAVVTGNLNGYRQTKTYRIRVRAGQTLSTEQVGGRRDITIYIKGPSGEDIGDSDASCNNRREITPTDAGDYTIYVVECRKADAWQGQFRFRVTVK